ncbi:DegV family protein [Vagococcus xieshaowenii]|uniref:DegV family protein n=1 Tax=Vagococcus xieshaowenii TaxID=2562451 RepID=A0AAJ5EDX3_9ENTE|nr:DegV family protein [Vagococcus xieshaowenii]QCA28694.1 DegV family protein [Vagococcus xieshaowenii]TFZ40498.1 DegV family protein [Vagococcus xieshaowenii]
MKKVKVVTDSSAKFQPGEAERLGIEVISLSVMIDDVIYKDTDLDGKAFMDMMGSARALPKTSQPPIGEFVELYDKLANEGYDIISLHMTGLLSGTVDAARQAAQLSQANVTVLDTKFIDQALAFVCERAAEVANTGATLEEVLDATESALGNSLLYIGIATLDNMVKGGRLSRATGILSNMLNIKAVMQLLPTGLETMMKGRGTKTFKKWFDDLTETQLKHLTHVKKIGISHADGLATAEKFKNALTNLFPTAEISVLDTSPLVATHTGAGAFAIMIYSENDTAA